MQSTLERISSLLSGDLNYDRVAEAKQLVNQLLDYQDSQEKPKKIIWNPKKSESDSFCKKLEELAPGWFDKFDKAPTKTTNLSDEVMAGLPKFHKNKQGFRNLKP